MQNIESISRVNEATFILGTIPAHSQMENTKTETWIQGRKQQLTKTMCKEEFCQLLSRVWDWGKQKQPIGRIMSVGGYESGTSLIESILKGWTGWRDIKNSGILQNEDCG